MIARNITFSLPAPWESLKFSASNVAAVNFLVGPNGSGKSQFAKTLHAYFRDNFSSSRLLGTDRLSGTESSNVLRTHFGDNFKEGLAKRHFEHLRRAGLEGSGIDTIILLEERLDLRIQVEATLSHLFNRKISLEWSSGHLVAFASIGQSGKNYRIDREECHGIKELLVLLTHLYNEDYDYLVIDEPELNLHPQYQAFFMQEVRRIAGDPTLDSRKKIVFLVTHSPFILDFRSIDDVKAVVSFDLGHSTPRQILDLDKRTSEQLSSLVPRLNVHHKQLFFSDNPIFVEGVLDAQLIGTIQEARGVSVAGAGSCIIDAGGCEEVNHYLQLCQAFGKKAHFVYDLDSLFNGNLRGCVRQDNAVQSFLAAAGMSNDFAGYCGELDRKLTVFAKELLAMSPPPPSALDRLIEFLNKFGPAESWTSSQLAKARVAILTALSRNREDIISATSEIKVSEIEGRLNQIAEALRLKNVHLLTGGTLERYLPSYNGDHFDLRDEQKRLAVVAEMLNLATPQTEDELKKRYGGLYDAVCKLPSKSSVDVKRVLRQYLGRYIHDLQSAITSHVEWGIDDIRDHMGNVQQTSSKVFSISKFERIEGKEFKAIISIANLFEAHALVVHVDHNTNSGMGGFEIQEL